MPNVEISSSADSIDSDPSHALAGTPVGQGLGDSVRLASTE